MAKGSMRLLHNWIVENHSRLRDLAWLVGTVGVALALLIYVFGTASHPVRVPIRNWATHRSENSIGPASFAALVAKIEPAIISVKVERIESVKMKGKAPGDNVLRLLPISLAHKAGEDKIIESEGSGFFISPDGYAVTNNHVIKHAVTITVTAYEGRSYPAKVVGADPSTDLALIKINARTHFVRFAKHPPQVGDWVLTVGDPFELDDTVTAGIVSGLGRNIDAGPYDDFVQIDAPINRGNSGGPAFDLGGNVIGVTTSIYSPCGGSVGIGFAIPATMARRIIVALKDKGHVVRGWMGVHVQSVTADIANSLGMNKPEGAIVTEPDPASPAADAGIEAGDVFMAVDGAAVVDRPDFGRLIAALPPGHVVRLKVLTHGNTKTVKLILRERPDERPKLGRDSLDRRRDQAQRRLSF